MQQVIDSLLGALRRNAMADGCLRTITELSPDATDEIHELAADARRHIEQSSMLLVPLSLDLQTAQERTQGVAYDDHLIDLNDINGDVQKTLVNELRFLFDDIARQFDRMRKIAAAMGQEGILDESITMLSAVNDVRRAFNQTGDQDDDHPTTA